MTLKEAHEGVGRRVRYLGDPNWPRNPRYDEGVITSVNFRYVFVRYGTQTTSKATDPGDLEWVQP